MSALAPSAAAAIPRPAGARFPPTARPAGLRVGARPLPVLERAAELAAARGPLRFALASLSARLIDTRGWDRLGFARIGDYGRERLGHSGRSLYDLAQGGRKLETLPRVRAALVSGALSWTKARLVARVACAEDEAAWLHCARALSADALEKQVRRVDRGSLEAGAGLGELEEVDEDGRPVGRETFWVRPCAAGARGHWHYARMLANRVTGRTCPPGEVLELVVAEVLSLIPAPEIGAEEEVPTPCKTQGVGKAVVPPHLCALPVPDLEPPAEVVLPEPVAGLLEGLDEADAFELDRRLRALVALEQRLDARMGELLAQVVRRRLHRLLGHRTLGAFAHERLGVSPSKARALLRLERAAGVCPELRRAYHDGRLSWVKAQALVPLLSLDACIGFRKDWLAWSQRVTTRRLEDDVDFSLTLRETDPAAWARAGGLPDEAQSPETEECQLRAKPRKPGREHDPENGSRLFIVAPREVTRLARAVLCTVRRRIERLVGRPVGVSEGFEAMLSHALESWGHPRAKVKGEHRIYARDGWRCAAPGCSSYRNLHAHHIRWRSRGGKDDPGNLITLCAYHHQRCIHAAPTLLRISGRAPDDLRFEMPWGRYRSGDVAIA